MPSVAVSADSTTCPAARRSLLASARSAGVSSTRRIVATTAGPSVPSRRHPPIASAADWRPAEAPERRPAIERQDDGEHASSPNLALQDDVASHRSGEEPADRQTETGARRGALRLVERLEDDLLLLGRDARPGVAHGDAETAVGRAARPRPRTSPVSVNFMAFPMRLTRICRTRWRSRTTCGRRSLSARRGGGPLRSQ